MQGNRLMMLLLVLLTAIAPALAAPPARPPNILFLFSDDQRADTIGALGNANITTPHLDGLVREGTSFRRAYCMGALMGAVCVPSRAMLMSGRTLFHVQSELRNQRTWPQQFGEAGYATFATGKWHNGSESLLRSFQSGKAVFLGGMSNPYSMPISDFAVERKLINRRTSVEHSVGVFADAAIEFIGSQKGAAKPFLAYVAFNSPHDPRIAPKAYHAQLSVRPPPLPANFMPAHPFNNGEMVVRDEKLAGWPRTPQEVRQHLADYYAYIHYMDDQIGRILSALDESGQRGNTIIVFTSDHGLAIGSHGLMGKQNLYDHSMRIPLIIAGPGVPKSKQTDAMCYLLDIFPTLADMAEVKVSEGSEGMSLKPVLQDKRESVRDSIFTAYRDMQRAVRDDRWKLIVYPKVNKTQLFDLAADPHEMSDLAADPAHAAEVKRLMALLADTQKQLGDTAPLRSEHPAPLQFKFNKVRRERDERATE